MAKVMIVTGGSRGIGAATARMAAAQDYDVAIAYAANQSAAESVAQYVRSMGARAIAVRCNVAIEADVLSLFETVDAQLGRLDVLVNCAGVAQGFGPIETHRVEDISANLNINVLGTILCAREAVKRMSRLHGGAGGAIINVSSVAARLGAVGFATPYAASKGAVDSFTVGLGREVAQHGIRVNAVTPGPIATDMNTPERRDEMAKTVPAGRVGEPGEVASAILWLASPQASYVYAANIDITGGR